MTEIKVLDNLIGTVSYSRKKGLPDYSSADAFFAIQFPIERDDTPEEIQEKANLCYAMCKAQVHAQLGLPQETAVASAMIQAAFGPETQVVEEPSNFAALPTAAPAPAGNEVAPNPPYDPSDWANQTKEQKAAIAEWAKDRFATNPHEFYDNRNNKRNPKAPDIKHRATGAAAWL